MRRYARCLFAVLLLLACGGTQISAQTPPKAITNADIVRMLGGGLSDEVVENAIRTAPTVDFDTTPDALIELRARRVSNAVINVMLERKGGRRASTATARGAARWEVDVHGGGFAGNSPSGGISSLPPAGATFRTSSLGTSRAASSWYFGDGAALLNAINATFTGFPVTGRITPLDPVLTAPGGAMGDGGTVGFRVSRTITPRISAEFTLDAPLSTIKLADSLLAGVEASRASFISAWNDQNGLLRSGGGVVFTRPSITSVSTIDDHHGRQLLTTGAARITFPAHGRYEPYATVGAGMISNIGDMPSVKLTGNYQFTSLNNFFSIPFSTTFPVNETDNVTIRIATDSSHRFAAVFGGGVNILTSSRWGLRADVRAYLSSNAYDVLLDATPQVPPGSPAGYIASTPTPSIQFSNNVLTGQPTTLSGAPINGFKTFSGSGTAVQMHVSIGYFVRF